MVTISATQTKPLPRSAHSRVDSGERQQDEEAAHRRRAALGQQVALRAVGADRLAAVLPGPQHADQPRADEEADQQRRQHRPAGAEGDVAEDVERRELVGERDEQVVEHG